jgi:hypothetical protein
MKSTAEKMTTLCKKLFGWMRKEKKPYVRFYSLEPGVVELFPIINSASLKRPFMTTEQVGDMPETLSSKHCPGIRKLVSTGWIITAPADFIIQTNGDGISFEYAETHRFSKVTPGRDSYVSSHSRSQVEPLLDDSTTTLQTVVKLETPWRVEASEDVILLQLPVAYNKEDRFQAATGFLDTKFGHVLNIQLFWKKLEGKYLVKAGTPLCQIIPMSRKNLSLSNYDVTVERYKEHDLEKEIAFNYAANCVFLNSDSLSDRLTRSINILKTYKKDQK